MTIDTDLRELDELLSSAGETWWRSKLRHARSMTGKEQAKYILQWCGGMGSFNDLILCEANGHSVPNAVEAHVNYKLRKRSSSLHDAAMLAS